MLSARISSENDADAKVDILVMEEFASVRYLRILVELYSLQESMFGRLRSFWPKRYQRGSLGKSHQNGDYLKQAMQKSCYSPTGFESLSGHCFGGSSLGSRAGSL